MFPIHYQCVYLNKPLSVYGTLKSLVLILNQSHVKFDLQLNK
jgi:hypothetical protein